MLISSN